LQFVPNTNRRDIGQGFLASAKGRIWQNSSWFWIGTGPFGFCLLCLLDGEMFTSGILQRIVWLPPMPSHDAQVVRCPMSDVWCLMAAGQVKTPDNSCDVDGTPPDWRKTNRRGNPSWQRQFVSWPDHPLPVEH